MKSYTDFSTDEFELLSFGVQTLWDEVRTKAMQRPVSSTLHTMQPPTVEGLVPDIGVPLNH